MAPSTNFLELDSSSITHQMPSSPSNIKSNSYDLTNDTIPKMIMSTSLQSFPESDNDSLSSSWRSSNRAQSPIAASPTSPRSIFKNYWSSPTHKNSLDKDEQDEILARLQTLQLPPPLVGEDDNDAAVKVVHQAPITATIEQKASLDDASIDYQVPTQSPNTRRRQILPTPPPTTAISSSLIMPRRQPMMAPYGGQRQWSSTTALVKRPNQSCLRKTRYSCSAIVASEATAVGREGKLHQGLRNSGCHDLSGRQRPRAVSDVSDLKKSVSFYSQVSVFEFAPEQRRSQKGWSKYFA